MSGEAPLKTRREPSARDASMDLLNQILRQPVDPDYAVVAARGAPRPRTSWRLGVVLLLAGALFAVAALQTSRAAPVQQSERAELIDRVQAAETRQDALRTRVDGLTGHVRSLRSAALAGDDQSRGVEARIARLGPVVGTVGVRGPGLLVVVDDASSVTGNERDRVLDLDLQVLANGLWQAGAEAVAINGHRLSTLTAIRNAGDAITVNYRSLNRPYRVEAIGDPASLPSRFAASPAGMWWHDLAQTRQMRYETSRRDDLVLAADPGVTLRYARRARS